MYIKKLNKLKILFFLAALIISGLPYLIANAKQEEPEYTPLTFKSQVGIPFSDIFSGADTAVGQYIASTGKMVSSLLPNYIKAVYDYRMAVVGILAAIILMGGGLLWLTSTGNESRISKAKELITGGLSGLVLLLSSWLLLNTINPNLLKFKPIITQVVRREVFDSGCCLINNKVSFKTKKLCNEKNGIYDKEAIPNFSTNKCDKIGCCIGEMSRCFNSTENQCKEIFPNNNSFLNSNCSTDSCNDLLSCDNQPNGEYPLNKNGGNVQVAYCYDGKFFPPTAGKAGEPCGDEKYSKCDEDKKEGGRTCEGDGQLGTRSCGAGLSCCRFFDNGLRINK